jgi:hypothetical protein
MTTEATPTALICLISVSTPALKRIMHDAEFGEDINAEFRVIGQNGIRRNETDQTNQKASNQKTDDLGTFAIWSKAKIERSFRAIKNKSRSARAKADKGFRRSLIVEVGRLEVEFFGKEIHKTPALDNR